MGFGVTLLQAAPQIANAVGAAIGAKGGNAPANGQSVGDAKGAGSAPSGSAMDKLRQFFQSSGGKVHVTDLERFIGNDPELNQAYASLKAKGTLANGDSYKAFSDQSIVRFTGIPEAADVMVGGKQVHYVPSQDTIDAAYKRGFTA